MSQEKLPREIVWDGAHLSDLGLTCLADGEVDILEKDAVVHADACDWCARRLGKTALLAEAVGAGVVAVEKARPSRAPARAAHKPWQALFAGVVVAMLAGLPMLMHLGRTTSGIMLFFTRGVPVLARGGFALATSQAVKGALPIASVAASALLVLMGMMIAGSAKAARARGVEGSAS
jgi:hypothetical protein